MLYSINIYIYFSLLEILVDINNHKYHLIINAKYQSFKINNVHTMSLADMLAALQRSYANSILFKF